MYNNAQEKVFEGLIAAVAMDYLAEENDSAPSNEELTDLYPLERKQESRYIKHWKNKQQKSPLIIIQLRRIAIVLLVLSSVFLGIMLTSAPVRAAINNTIVTWYKEYVQIHFQSNESGNYGNLKNINDLTINYIPTGFSLSSSEENENKREYLYSNDIGEYFFIGIYCSDDIDIASDIENSDYEIEIINGFESYIIYDSVNKSGSVIIGNENYTITVTAIIEKSTLLEIAKNIN